MPATLRARSFAALPVMLVAVLVATMFGFSSSADAAAAARDRRIMNALDITRNQKGDPYQYGATGPNRFDCSGLIYYSFRRAGFTHVPRTASEQAHFVRHIPRSRMHKGDLMFFYSGGSVYHVAVFSGWSHGHRLMIHAPNSGERVRTEKPWTSQWFAGTLR